MKSLPSHLAEARARRHRRQADKAHTRALRARDERDARGPRPYEGMSGTFKTAVTGRRRETSQHGFTEFPA